LRKEVSRLETELDTLHTRQKQLEALLADTEIYAEANKAQLQNHLREKAEIDQQTEACEEAWLTASEALEVAQRDLEKI
jgi:ATP-binding cassette subfamily F protein 3